MIFPDEFADDEKRKFIHPEVFDEQYSRAEAVELSNIVLMGRLLVPYAVHQEYQFERPSGGGNHWFVRHIGESGPQAEMEEFSRSRCLNQICASVAKETEEVMYGLDEGNPDGKWVDWARSSPDNWAEMTLLALRGFFSHPGTSRCFRTRHCCDAQ